MVDKRDLTICTYFRSNITPPEGITLFEGNGSLKGFFQVMRAALDAKPYDVIHAHSPHVAVLLLGILLLRYRKLAFKTVLTVHDSYPDYKLRNRLLFIPVFAGFRKVVCCSEASLTSFPGLYKWLAGRRLCFVRNGVDIARVDRTAATAREQGPRSKCFTVVAVSRLVDIKNPSCAIAAFRLGTDHTSHFEYIGDGPLRSSLMEEARTAGLENRIEFTGLVPREKVFQHLVNAAVFISTSRGEGLPISVLEAMACGCPVILSDIPPHREIADSANFIPLIDPDDVEGFAHEIRRYREMTAEERLAVGQQCRRLVEERFSLERMHIWYGRVYAQISNNMAPSLSEKLDR